MEGCCITRVDEAVDCGRRQGQNGGSLGSARRQDDALGRWWEMVPPLGILFRLAMGGDNGAERLVCNLVATSVRTPVRPM